MVTKHPLGVSVIIPTYRDTETLKRCLDALHLQEYPEKHLEIIVVNNDPNDDLSYLAKDFPKLIILSESKAGSYAARNKGISRANKEIIAFTDSDCIPKRDWIKNAVLFFNSHPECAILGGRVNKKFINPDSPTLIELYDQLSYHLQEKYISKYHFAVTANIFVRKNIFSKIGMFNEELKSGGDSEFGNRAWLKGYQICYDPKILVSHRAIHNLNKLVGKTRRIAGGKFQKNNLSKLSFVSFLNKIFGDFYKSIRNATEVKNHVPFKTFIKLLSLETFLQCVVLVEYLKLKTGRKPLRSY